MRRLSLLLALLLGLSDNAIAQRAGSVTVAAEGSGTTREAAIGTALVLAVEQGTGVIVAGRQESTTAFAQLSIENAEGDSTTVTVAEGVRSRIARLSGGIVSSYRVLEVRREAATFVARIEAEVAVYRPTTNTAETRRSLAVSNFTDQAGHRTAFGEQLRERLIGYLTQSRRFAVLDRANAAAYDQEMALLATDAPVTERVRIGRVLGADYIVVGRMRNVGVTRTEEYISLTGERIVSQSARGDIEFQVLEIATRQVRWASSVRVGNTGNLGQVLDAMATQLGREITQTIYPMRLIRMDDPNELILNQGGVTVDAGQRFRAMVMGDELSDPYTRESLGRVEREIGVVQVMRVDTRVSYGRLVAGALPPAGADVVLRPAPPAPPTPAARPRTPSDGGRQSAAPRLPFN
jgi:curli biogenesis system outer membrane secretion channel CsgG